MNYAILNGNDRVANIVVASAAFAADKRNWILAPDGVEIGDTYNKATKQFTKPIPNANRAKRAIKQQVRELLRRTDWTQVPDNLGPNKQDAWKTWRQKLRTDVLAAVELDPFTVVFPDPPGDLDEDGL